MERERPNEHDGKIDIEPEALQVFQNIFSETQRRLSASRLDFEIIEEALSLHPAYEGRRPLLLAQAILQKMPLDSTPARYATDILFGLRDLVFFLRGRIEPMELAQTAADLENEVIEHRFRALFDKHAQAVLRGEEPDALLEAQFNLLDRLQAYIHVPFDWVTLPNDYEPGYFLRSLKQVRDESVLSTVLPREAITVAFAIAGYIAENAEVTLSGEVLEFIVRFLQGQNVDIEIPRICIRLDGLFSSRSTVSHGEEIDQAAIATDAQRILDECQGRGEPAAQCEYLLSEIGPLMDAIVRFSRTPAIRDHLARELHHFIEERLLPPAYEIFFRHLQGNSAALTPDEQTVLAVNGFFIRPRTSTQPIVSPHPPLNFGGSVAEVLPEHRDLSPPHARRP